MAVADSLGVFSKDDPEARYHNFDSFWRKLLPHFGNLNNLYSKSITWRWHRLTGIFCLQILGSFKNRLRGMALLSTLWVQCCLTFSRNQVYWLVLIVKFMGKKTLWIMIMHVLSINIRKNKNMISVTFNKLTGVIFFLLCGYIFFNTQ